MGYGHVNRALPEVFDSLRRAAAANVQAFDAQGLAHMLWALAKTSRALPETCDAVCRAAAGNVQAFNALGLANALWAMTTTSQVLSESFDPPHEHGSVEEANVRSASSAGPDRGRAPAPAPAMRRAVAAIGADMAPDAGSTAWASTVTLTKLLHRLPKDEHLEGGNWSKMLDV